MYVQVANQKILPQLAFKYVVSLPPLGKHAMFLTDTPDLAFKVLNSTPLVRILLLSLNEEHEQFFIRCLSIKEVNLFVNQPFETLPYTYTWKGSRGLRYFALHLYLKGWTMINPHYLDESTVLDYYLCVHDGTFKPNYRIKSILSNRCDGLDTITNKHLLYDFLLEHGLGNYMAKRYTMFDYEVPYPIILKPVGKAAFGGHGIHIVNSKFEYQQVKPKLLRDMDYGAYEYINDPLLFDSPDGIIKGHKFHLRVYWFVSAWRCKLVPYFRILHAKSPYQKGQYSNQDIHDTHLKGTFDNYFLPQDLYSPRVNQEIDFLCDELSKVIVPKAYPESTYAYDLLGLDIMVRRDHSIVLLEINTFPGCHLKQPSEGKPKVKSGLWFTQKVIKAELSFLRDFFEVSFKEFRHITDDESSQLLKIASNPLLMKSIGEGKPWTAEYLKGLVDGDKTDCLDPQNASSVLPITKRQYINYLVTSRFKVIGYLGLRPIKGKVGLQVRIFVDPPRMGYGKMILRLLLTLYKQKIWAIVALDNVGSNALFDKFGWVKTVETYSGSKHNIYYFDNRVKLMASLGNTDMAILAQYYSVSKVDPKVKGADFCIQDKPTYQEVKGVTQILLNPKYDATREMMGVICAHTLNEVMSYLDLTKPKYMFDTLFECCKTYDFIGFSGLPRYTLMKEFRFWKPSNTGMLVRAEQVFGKDKYRSDDYHPCFLKNRIRGMDSFTNKDLLYDKMSKYMCKTFKETEINTIPFEKDGSKVYIVKPVGRGAFKGVGVQVVNTLKDLKGAVDAIRKANPKWRVTIQEYITNPLTFSDEGKGLFKVKFHARVHILVASWGSYLYDDHEFLTAAKPFKNSDYGDRGIHDSHGASTPFDYELKIHMAKRYDRLHQAITEVFDYLQKQVTPIPQEESVLGYECYGLDIMFSKDKGTKKIIPYLLEMNDKVGHASDNPNSVDRVAWMKRFIKWEYDCIKHYLP